MIVGMDFGTTNSGMAVYDGRTVNILPLDPHSANPQVLRSALYITNEQVVQIGRKAIDYYYEQNIGRIVKTRRVWIGEIEVYAEDMYYVTDAYAWVDISEPGRLMLSIKSRLREEDHPGAIIGQHFYPLEDLIALYLSVTKVRAETMLGQEINQVVLGRPVHFSTDDTHDRLAQGRLLQAAFRAGYEKVYLQFEPIATAFNYERTLSEAQNVLVFDFGGGTLDITVMRLGDPAQRKVLSTGGVPIAGDVFDQKATRAKLPKHFGEGSLYGPRHKAMAMPRWIFDAFANWQTIIELQSPQNKRVLEDIARTAQRRHQIEALISLVSSNYGLKMFDEVEQAKRVLSEKRGAQIRLDGPDFKVRDFVTRSEFEKIIRNDVVAIEAELLRTVAASGLAAEEIDAVIRTGGSAQIPVFYEMLGRHFGAAKVQSVDTFGSVTAGLGIIAHGIEMGQIEARAYTPADVVPPPQAQGSRPQISPVNLSLMQKRILMDEGATTEVTAVPQKVLVLLGEGLQITAVSLATAKLASDEPLLLAEWGISMPICQAVVVDLDEQLLLISSHYRFLLLTPRQLLDLQSMEMQLTDLHRLEKRESFALLGRWTKNRDAQKMLLITNRGYARAYPLAILRANIEAPVPLKFDHPLLGTPIALFGTENKATFAAVTHGGRGLRWSVSDLRAAGAQVVNCGKDDLIAAAVLAEPEDELFILTADGYARRLLSEWLPRPPKPNSKGRSLIARRSPVVGLIQSTNEGRPHVKIVTSQRVISVGNGRIPLEDSTKSYRLLNLRADEIVHCIVS